jgi:quinol monooxygenase YgiN
MSTRRSFLGVALLSVLAIASAAAQTQAASDGPRYVVTYIDVMPTAAGEGAAIVRAMRDAARGEAGNLRGEAAQRIGMPDQFVLLEVWKDQPSLDAHSKSAQAGELREKLKPMLAAPADERVNTPLSVGPVSARLGTAAMIAVTHVDVLPTQLEKGATLVAQLAEDGRGDAGNILFEALTQASRANHFTVIDAWASWEAADAHRMSAKTRAFREGLAPAIGAPYDERLYRPLN